MKEQIEEKDFIDFLLQSKTKREILEKFKNSDEKEVDNLLAEKHDDFRLVVQFNVHNEKTFLFVPVDPTKIVLKPRIWKYRRQKDDQPYIVVDLPDSDWKRVKIIPISDVLFGSRLHDAPLFEEYVNWIARNPQVFVFLNGDIFAYQKYIGSLIGANSRLRFKISRIAHKILWALQGDEERKNKNRRGGFDPLEDMCAGFGIPYFEEPVYADVVWKKNIFSFYCIHGFTTSQTKGGKINAAIRPLDFQEHTMFMVMSHAKDSLTKQTIRVCRDPVKFDLLEKEQHVIISPGFSSYFGSPWALKGYSPPSKGTVSCNLESDGDYYISV